MNRRRAGQGGIEMCLWMVLFAIVVVAMNRYVRFSVAGRVKSAADGVSPTLFNSSGGEVAFLRCQESEDVKEGVGAASRSRFASQANDRTDLSNPVPAYALSDCPRTLLQ